MAEPKKARKRVAKLELIGGQAKPGPALASLGINMPQFTRDFNDKTRDRNGEVVPVLFTILPNKSFTFEIKTTPTAIMIKKALGLEKGAAEQRNVAATLPRAELRRIAEYKMKDSNAGSIGAMERMVAGTARQMGVAIGEE